MWKPEMILLFSGGIDSYVAWHYLDHPHTVYFNIGSRYTRKEISHIRKLIPGTYIDSSIHLGDREVGENAYIPFRNLYLAMLATKYSDNIVIAGLKDDLVSDKNEQIFAKWTALLSEMEGRSITVTSPFWQMTKEEVVGWYLNQGLDRQTLIGKTISCYAEDRHDKGQCWKCPACFRKWNALWNNGIKLPFLNKTLMLEYVEKAEAGHYVPERNRSILKAMQEYKKI